MTPPEIQQFSYTIAKISATLAGLIFVAITGFYLPNVKTARERLITYSPLLALGFPDYLLTNSISNLTVLLLPLFISFNLLLDDYLWVSAMNLLFILYILYFSYHTIFLTTQYFIGDRIGILKQIKGFVYFRVAYLPLIVFSISFLIAIFFLFHIKGWYLFLSILPFFSFIKFVKFKCKKSYIPTNSEGEDKKLKKPVLLDILSWMLLLLLSIGLCTYLQSEATILFISTVLIFAGLLLISVDYFIFRDKSLFFQLEQHPFGIIKTSIQEFRKRLDLMIENLNREEIKAPLESIYKPIKDLDFDLIEKTNLIIANDIIKAKESVYALRELSENNPQYKEIFKMFNIFEK